MRHGFLAAITALTAGATLAWGQYPAGGVFGNPSVIPPPLPIGQASEGDPASGAPTYPTPANWDGSDLNGPAGGNNGSVPRWWLGTEVLVWFAKPGAYSVPLATTSSPNDGGVLGNPTTTVVDGAKSIPSGALSGYRFNGGFWFDATGRWGMMAEGFSTGTHGHAFFLPANTSGSPVLARPYISDQTGAAGAYVATSLNQAAGYIYDGNSLSIAGADMNFMMNLYRSAPDNGMGYGASLLAGARWMTIGESVTMFSQSSLLSGASTTFDNQTYSALIGTVSTSASRIIPRGSGFLNLTSAVNTTAANTVINVNVMDQFKTRNDFYGGNFGLYQQFNMGRWGVGMATSIAMGDMYQGVDINGGSTLQNINSITQGITIFKPFDGTIIFHGTTTSQTATNATSVGGVYALNNNIGHYSRNVFAVIPDGNIKLSYAISPGVTCYAGINATYISNIVRAPSEITGTSNPNQQPTSATYGNPSLPHSFNAFPSTDFWLMGVNFGLNFRY